MYGDLPRAWTFSNDHLKDNIIGDSSKGASTQNQLKLLDSNLAFLSHIKPKSAPRGELGTCYARGTQSI